MTDHTGSRVATTTAHGSNPYVPLTHHGRTLASWVGSIGAAIGFVIATIGFLIPGINVPVIVIGMIVVLGSAAAGGVLRSMGYGAKEN